MAATERAFVAQPIGLSGGRVIASPFQFYTTGEDRLRIVTLNAQAGVVLTMRSRFVDTGGNVQANADTHTPNTDRTTKTTDHELGVGALLNLTVFASSGTPKMGQTFVIVQLVRGFGAAAIVLGTLLAGYVTSTQHLAWPGSPVTSSLEGPGNVRQITGTNPAVGAEISEAVPTGARWEMLGVVYQLNTAAPVGQRFPCLRILASSQNVALLPPGPYVDGGTAAIYSWGIGLGTQGLQTSAFSSASMPTSLPLLAGTLIQTVTVNMNVGDQFVSVSLYVREWLEAA